MLRFENADAAFKFYFDHISKNGLEKPDSLFIKNEGFYIENPLDNHITHPLRKWNEQYARREFSWYLSKNRSVKELKKYAKIWDKMHGGDDIVNSNYGWQWSRENQLMYVVEELLRDKNSRRAFLTIYDGKEHKQYKFDTPCTLNIGFDILDGRLNMTVLMRSNDLWFGFCNDQYCFSRLLEEVSKTIKIPVGYYYHFAADLHLYKEQLSKLK